MIIVALFSYIVAVYIKIMHTDNILYIYRYTIYWQSFAKQNTAYSDVFLMVSCLISLWTWRPFHLCIDRSLIPAMCRWLRSNRRRRERKQTKQSAKMFVEFLGRWLQIETYLDSRNLWIFLGIPAIDGTCLLCLDDCILDGLCESPTWALFKMLNGSMGVSKTVLFHLECKHHLMQDDLRQSAMAPPKRFPRFINFDWLFPDGGIVGSCFEVGNLGKDQRIPVTFVAS